MPKDYTEYVGNSEKSCGVYGAKGLLSDDEKRELREMLRNTQSCIWDCVISFREEFGDEYCRDYEQAYNFLKKELPKFFTRAGLDKDNIVWYAGLHENTEIVKLRKNLKEEFNGSTNIFEMTRTLKRKFLKLYSQIPKQEE